MSRAWIAALLALGVSLAGPARAQSWTITRLYSFFGGTLPAGLDLSLSAGGRIALREGTSTQNVSVLRRETGIREYVAYASSSSGLFSALRLRQFGADDKLLLGTTFRAPDPRGGGIFTWDRHYGLVEIHSLLAASGVVLDPLPDRDAAGRVLYFETTGGVSTLRRRLDAAVEPWSTSCSGMTRAETSAGGQVAFDCGTPTASVIWGGDPAAPAVLVDGATFGTPGLGRHVPYGFTDANELLLLRSIFAPTGWHWRSPGGLEPLASESFCNDIEMNQNGVVMCVAGPELYVADLPSTQLVVGPSTPIDSATPTALAPAASLNDLGQVAFAAQLSNGTAGVYLATPSSCDADLDGHCDVYDNCPGYTDPSQLDHDEDGLGNRCDNCPFHPNPDQLDSNADGRGDACAPCSASGVPRCGVRAKGSGSDVFTLTGIPLSALPARPGFDLLAKSLTPGLVVDVSMVGFSCSPPPSPFTSNIFENFDGDGIDARALYDHYPRFADRAPVTCSVEFRASGSAGSYFWLIDAHTVPPQALDARATTVTTAPLTLAAITDSIDFIDEATNHRFLYDGTGGANFGTCTWNPDPPISFGNTVVYSGGGGPGWDCCTFQFDGVDGIESTVGQLVFDLNGAPPPPDPDGDAFLSPCDNCPYFANDQFDGGGVGSATPDQIGDACQCGRVAADAIVDTNDVTALRNHLRASPTLAADALSRCSVIGGQSECTIRTATVLRRALAVPALGPGIAQTCTAALPP